MNPSRQFKTLLGFAFMIGMVWLYSACTPAAQGTVQPNPTATAPVVEPVETATVDLAKTATFVALAYPSATSTLTSAQKAAIIPTAIPPTVTPTITPEPACAFPLAQTTTIESQPEKYIFSEPKVVKTAKYGIDIAGWLPDNQIALVMYDNDHLFDGIKGYLQTIELFNPETQKSQIYATRRDFGEKFIPAWNPALNAIIYPAPNVLGIDTTNHLITTRQIRISYGNPDETLLLLDDLPRYYVAVKPDGSQVVYLKNNGKQLYQFYSRVVSQGSLEAEQLIPFDSGLFGHDDYPITYETAWRPGASQVFFYNAISSINRSLLLDVNTEQVCSFNFDGWVYFARWSPNGRYLAMITSKGSHHPIWVNYDLNVLDTLTGKLYKLDSAKIGPPNLAHVVSDMAWAPDNHHLAIIGTAYAASTSPPPPIVRLYLVDFLSGEVDNLFPSYQIYGGSRGTDLAWSPDGSKLLANCSTEKGGGLCFISVQRSGQ